MFWLWFYIGLGMLQLNFEDVDKEFVKFVRNEVQDYDSIKHENFYIID